MPRQHDGQAAIPAHGNLTPQAAAEDLSPASIATAEWWRAGLARQFGEGALRVQVEPGSDEVLILGSLGTEDAAALEDFIESSGQGDRVRNLVKPV